jgi:RND superfamily putative drug exporter
MTDPFARYGYFIARRRWVVLIVWLLILPAAGAIGSHAVPLLQSGGFVAVNSQSDRAAQILQKDFHADSGNIITAVLHSKSLTVSDPAFKKQVNLAAQRLRSVTRVKSVLTFYSTRSPLLVSHDRHTTLVVASANGNQNQMQDVVTQSRDKLKGISIQHLTAGPPAIGVDTGTASENDLKRAELVTAPIVLLLLLLVFRTVISAAVPLLLGASSILLCQALLVPIASSTDVSIFALNVSSMIGLGLGIDFSLIFVSRFRQEMALGLSTPDALATTMATAGRSIVFSGITVIVAMAVFTGLMLPVMVVRSISMAVMLVAFTALLGGVTFLPAILALLGHRLEWLPILPRRKATSGQGFWYRLSHIIMRQPWPWLVGGLLVLLVLAFPARELNTEGASASQLPASAESVKGTKLMQSTFGAGSLAPIQVVIRTKPGGVWTRSFLTGVQRLAQRASADRRNSRVDSLVSLARTAGVPASKFATLHKSFFTGNKRLAAAAASYVNTRGKNDVEVVTIYSRYDQYATRHEGFVQDLRQTIIPSISQFKGRTVLVGGQSASFLDLRDQIYNRFPFVIVGVMVAVFIILMMFFQSLLLPLKAILLNLASILATYGVLVMVFQHGWFHQLIGLTPVGRVSVVTPPILYSILFALSTDYEVFMLSRVKEFYHALHDNAEAVASGLQNTAGVITAAGIILIATFGSFATAGVVNIKEIGIGLAVAVALDTTIVRVVLVPSSMRLMGNANWWMPSWLKRIVPEISEGPAAEIPPAAAQPALVPMQATGPAAPAGVAVPASATLRPTGGSIGTERVDLPSHGLFRIGRDERNELQLFDPMVSRFHARIERVDGGYLIRDLGSTNGIYVNYERVPPKTTKILQPGDTIQVAGKWELSFAFDAAPVSQAAPTLR